MTFADVLRSSWGLMLANAHAADMNLLFALVAFLFVLGALYLLIARSELIGAVVAVVIAILIVVFLV